MYAFDKVGQVFLKLGIVQLLQKGDIGGSIDVWVGWPVMGFLVEAVARQLVGGGQANSRTLGPQ